MISTEMKIGRHFHIYLHCFWTTIISPNLWIVRIGRRHSRALSILLIRFMNLSHYFLRINQLLWQRALTGSRIQIIPRQSSFGSSASERYQCLKVPLSCVHTRINDTGYIQCPTLTMFEVRQCFSRAFAWKCKYIELKGPFGKKNKIAKYYPTGFSI